MTEPASPTDRLDDGRYDPVAERLIDALETGVAGCPGIRLNHARGVLLQGRFTATTAAARLTTAAHMQGDAVPVLVRFSSSTGLPDVAENEARANPRGIAVRFFLPDGSATDLIGHSVDGFPARIPDEFLRFLQAASCREAEPEAFERHLRENAAAARYLASIPSTPRSFAVERFSMLHGFALGGPEGRVSIGRFHIRPSADDRRLTPEEAVQQPSGFLTREIIERVASAGCDMQLVFQLADASDRTDDISSAWPGDRPEITLGTLFLDRVAPDQDEQARILFDPARLTPGIQACGDPMLELRSAAYHVAFRRRVPVDFRIMEKP